MAFVVSRRMLLGRCGEMCYLNKLLMVSVLGWLFQVISWYIMSSRTQLVVIYLQSSFVSLSESHIHFCYVI